MNGGFFPPGGGSFDPHSPGAIGDVTPSTGAFTTASAGVVTGTFLTANADLNVAGNSNLNTLSAAREFADTPSGNHIFKSHGSDNVLELLNYGGSFSAVCLDRAFRGATLTFSGAPSNGQTVIVGGKTYTFQTTLTNVDGNVLIGASQATAQANIVSAINLSSGSGSTYAAATTAGQVFSAVAASTINAWERATNTSALTTSTSTTVTGAAWDGVLRLGSFNDNDGCATSGINRNVSPTSQSRDFAGYFFSTNPTTLDAPGAAGIPETIVFATQQGTNLQPHRRIYINTPIRGGHYNTTIYGVTVAVGTENVLEGPMGVQVQSDGRVGIGGTPDATTGDVTLFSTVQLTITGQAYVSDTLYLGGSTVQGQAGQIVLNIDSFSYISIRSSGTNQNQYSTFGGTGSNDGHRFFTGNPSTVRLQIRDDVILATVPISGPNSSVLMTPDTGWTANADAGDKTQSIGSSASIATIATALNIVSSGAGTLLQAVAQKCKALETASVAAKLANA